MELVRQYAADYSEGAFAALVSRHTNLVYSTALRRLGSPQLAEEVTQAVFIILARKAGSLGRGTILSGWLYRTTCYVAGHAFKQELRRQQRHQDAFMQSLSDETDAETWSHITPLLEDAMLRLRQTDRDALVMRFFEGRTIKEVGDALGISEAATKMRLNRALEKLRGYFCKHGVTSTTAAIAGAISANSVHAAPVALANTAAAIALAKGATVPASTVTLIKGALKTMAWTNAKTVTVGALVLACLAATPVVIHRHHATHTTAKSAPPEIWTKDSLANAGYQTPDAALQTLLWAMTHADLDAVKASATPEMRASMEKDMKGVTQQDFAAMIKTKFGPVTGFRITDRKTIAPDVVEIDFEVQGANKDDQSVFRRIDGEWKFERHPDSGI